MGPEIQYHVALHAHSTSSSNALTISVMVDVSRFYEAAVCLFVCLVRNQVVKMNNSSEHAGLHDIVFWVPFFRIHVFNLEKGF